MCESQISHYTINVRYIYTGFYCDMLKRFLNIIIFLTLPLSVYATFSVKNDVYDMQKQQKLLTRKILNEHNIMSIYRAEWANLTATNNISYLSQSLMPEYKTAEYSQMLSAQYIPEKPIEDNNFSLASYRSHFAKR